MNRLASAVKLSLRYYARSFRYGPPMLAVGLFVAFAYTVVPNPVMESYALTSALLFAMTAWAGYGFVDAEHDGHRLIAALHAGGYVRYWTGRLLAGLLFLVPVPAALMTVYPIAFGKFERAAEPAEAAAAFAAHLALGMLGFAVAVWFSRKLFAKPYTALTGLFLTVSVALAAEGLAQSLPPGLRGLVWLLPPVRPALALLGGFAEAGAADLLAGLVWPALYASALLAAFAAVRSRRHM